MALTTNQESIHQSGVIDYYRECWLSRFKEGHNPKSLAMHLGYFRDNQTSNDDAKTGMNEFLAAQIGLSEKSALHIADAGCGVGGTCLYLARQYPDLNITGINIASDQIEFAKEKAAQNNLSDRIDFIVSDFIQTPLSDSSVDILFAIESVCHSTDKAVFFREALRILRPGGRLILIDYVLNTDAVTSDQQSARLLKDFQTGWMVDAYLDSPDVHLKAAGFTDVKSLSLIDRVKNGINLSHNKASAMLSGDDAASLSDVMRNHLKACCALKELVERRVIDYMISSGVKPGHRRRNAISPSR